MKVSSILANFGLAALSALFFAASFPNLLFENGVPFFAWIAYFPIFVLLYRVNLAASIFWGALYGYASYGLFNYWLAVFHPLAGFIVGSVYLVYNAALFFLLRLAVDLFPRRAYLAQYLIWLAYEYLCAQGFLGYSFGITGYSQWRILPLIQIANIFGVWGVCALVVFPSAWIGAAWGMSREPGTGSTEKISTASRFILCPLLSVLCSRVAVFYKREKAAAFVWMFALAIALIYGLAVSSDYSAAPTANIALIQQNTDPWQGGIDSFRRDYLTLKRLSDEALAVQPKPDMVVWSETAFVPRIYWHQIYRDDQDSWLLVKELLVYLALQDVPFVIGNNDARADPSINPDPDEFYRVDYNAAMLFENGAMSAIYRKLHLVPFTEHFPYRKQLPAVYRALKDADTHFWEKGDDLTVFSGPGFKFSTPICFEDTFGYISRLFVKNGAQALVNLTNDAWSKSLPAQNQHLSMSVFRAVENRRSMVRAAASGQTCGIAPNGRIIAMAPPFCEAWLNVEVPIVSGLTIYTRFGDYLGICFTIAAFILLLFGGVKCIMGKSTKRRKV